MRQYAPNEAETQAKRQRRPALSPRRRQPPSRAAEGTNNPSDILLLTGSSRPSGCLASPASPCVSPAALAPASVPEGILSTVYSRAPIFDRDNCAERTSHTNPAQEFPRRVFEKFEAGGGRKRQIYRKAHPAPSQAAEQLRPPRAGARTTSSRSKRGEGGVSAFVWRGISAPIRRGRYHCWPGLRRARTFPSESASVCVSACESGRVWLAPRPFIRSPGQDKSTCVSLPPRQVSVEQAESAEQPTLLLNGEVLQNHQVEQLTGHSGGGTPGGGQVEHLREEVQDLVVGEEEYDEEDEFCGEDDEDDDEDDDEEDDEDDEDENSADDLEELDEEEEDEEEELVKKAQEEERIKREQEEKAKKAKEEEAIQKAPKEDLVKEKREADLIEDRPRRNQDSPKIGVKQRIEEATRRAENEERKHEKELENHRQKANNKMADAKKSRFGGNIEKCSQCTRTVYAMEKLEVAGRVMHKTCFRCCKCNSQLSVGRFSIGGDDLYCMTHYKQAFREKGTYDVFTPNNPCKGKWEAKAQQ
ncbi:uncharacterized protein LOC134779639 [Penaeus indicus]|uniref:uncharacterized protein LOC134779639 n=1 Tax=Penaeus indicus TaxID=29960 RepID=UPI00300C6871